MRTLKIGIADYDRMKARTMATARGERKPAKGEPTVWFTSVESFAKALSRTKQCKRPGSTGADGRERPLRRDGSAVERPYRSLSSDAMRSRPSRASATASGSAGSSERIM